MNDPKDYEIGRGKPPRAHQFKKGVCANPKGRGYKKGPAAGELFVQVQNEKIAAEGIAKSLPRIDLAIKLLTRKALKGNLNAIEMLFKMHQESLNGGDFKGDGTKSISAQRDKLLEFVEWDARPKKGRHRRRKKMTQE